MCGRRVIGETAIKSIHIKINVIMQLHVANARHFHDLCRVQTGCEGTVSLAGMRACRMGEKGGGGAITV